MPLKIAIIGAGIGGLSSAVALQKLGHFVTVFEKSKFASEIGAAINLSPNGIKILTSLKFDFERARACPMRIFECLDGYTLETLTSLDQEHAEARYGCGFMSVHRADLHNELLRLIITDGQNPIDLRLGTAAEVMPTHQKNIFAVRQLIDGTVLEADLVICANGIHSDTRKLVLGTSTKPCLNMRAFRFTIPTADLDVVDDLARLREWKSAGTTVIADTKLTESERHLVWYACRGGEIQNIVAVYPTKPAVQVDVEKDRSLMEALLSEFGHLHIDIAKLVRLAKDITHWDLPYYDPFTHWSNGNLLLIGDAAHPMQPFGAQGANQTLEDAGALGILLRNVHDGPEAERRLHLFEDIRLKRTSVIQILSSARIGREDSVADRLQKFVDPGAVLPRSFQDRTEYSLGFDILKECNTRLFDYLGETQTK